jgi:AraC family transcriptional regulator
MITSTCEEGTEKEQNGMDFLQNMNLAMEYIERHLTDEISPTELAGIAGCSAYHFARMFSFISGIPLSEYIRHRRLTAAAFDLQRDGVKVIDVAMKYGYDSPTSFNRAFQNLHGIPPKEARVKGRQLKSYPVMSFHLSVRGDVQMNYRIEEKGEFTIAGIKERMTMVAGEENFKRITELWANLSGDDAGKIMSLSDGFIEGLIGVSANHDGESFDYYIAATTGGNTETDLPTLCVRAATWAVFESVGALPDAIVGVWRRIFSEWFPNSGYENAELPTLEIYSEGDITADDYKCELWVPIVKA